MPLEYRDGDKVTRVSGYGSTAALREEKVMSDKNVTTEERLYDVDVHGIKFLAYPAGSSVPADEHERLTSAEHKAMLAGEDPEGADRAELRAEAAELGLSIAGSATAGEIRAAINQHRSGSEAADLARLDDLKARAAELELDVDAIADDDLESAIEVELERLKAEAGLVKVTDPESGVTFTSGAQGQPEHHAAADEIAAKPAAELLELARAAGLDDVPDTLEPLEGDALGAAKWALAERLVLKACERPTGADGTGSAGSGDEKGSETAKPATGKAALLIRAKELGLDLPTSTKVDELKKAIEKAEKAAGK